MQKVVKIVKTTKCTALETSTGLAFGFKPPNYMPYMIFDSSLEAHDCAKWWIKLLLAEGQCVLQIWANSKMLVLKEKWPMDLASFTEWTCQTLSRSNDSHNPSCSIKTATKYILNKWAVITEHFWYKQTKNSMSMWKYLQVSNSLRRQNYLQDEACNYLHFHNEAIMKGRHTDLCWKCHAAETQSE